MNSENVVVIDCGTESTKAGFAQDPFPRGFFPTLVGRFRQSGLTDGYPDIYCGAEAATRRGVSIVSKPVNKGFIKNYEDMEKLWHHVFYKELLVAPEESSIMYAVHPLIQKKDIDRMSEILFETFAIKGMYLAKSPVLALHASGRTTGTVWESGAGCAHASPIFEGFLIKNATVTSELTGNFLSDLFSKMLAERGYFFTTPKEIEILHDIKKKLCCVVDSYEEAQAPSEHTKYELPDGEHILVGEERKLCPEALFGPVSHGLMKQNVVDCISRSISMCELEYQPVFYDNVVLSGGSTTFPGFAERLLAGLNKQLVRTPQVATHASVDTASPRHLATWLGGAVLGSLTCLNDFWTTCAQYSEHGTEIVNQKFF